ncbi:MAG TPA: nuclear transport factor 2 family protein [Candidatus Limnocylindrales bacterium]|nr:nuclear transport factor 2 family protein [Candidatus Limnocylindrales bacterium]
MGDERDMAVRLEEAFRRGDYAGLPDLIDEFATDDFVEEWPQSGERLTRAASKEIAANYADRTGTNPRFRFRRMLGGGDMFVVEGTVDYGDGVPVSYVGIGEIRDGRVSRLTEYFASPFEPPEWRAEYAERMESALA